MPAEQLILQGVNALTGLTNAVGGLVDKNKQVRYQQALTSMSAENQQKLNDALLSANSEAQRQQILASVLGSIGQARVEALSKLQSQKQKNTAILLIGGLVAVTVISTLIILSNKS